MKRQAFTLIELLIAISIAGILLIIGIPAMHGFVMRNEAAAEANNIVSALQFARSEAIKRDVNIKFCKKGRWRDGQIVETLQGKILRVFPALPVGDELIWDSSLGKNDCVEFSTIGSTNGQRGTFYYYPHGEKKDAKKVIINAAGRIRVEN
jgi:type IV fimbrial biogenesis protein FimT